VWIDTKSSLQMIAVTCCSDDCIVYSVSVQLVMASCCSSDCAVYSLRHVFVGCVRWIVAIRSVRGLELFIPARHGPFCWLYTSHIFTTILQNQEFQTAIVERSRLRRSSIYSSSNAPFGRTWVFEILNSECSLGSIRPGHAGLRATRPVLRSGIESIL